MPDDRLGYPSASSLERLLLCPGSWNLEKLVPDDNGEASPEADSGTRIHAALGNELSEDKLTDDELEVVRACDRLTNELAESTYGRLQDAHTLIRERRLWYFNADQRPLFSGKPDLVAVYGLRALIVDYKSGRGYVTAAHSNIQLRALVALVSKVIPIREATVAIIQPRGEVSVTKASYNEDDIMMARDELEGIIGDALKADAKREPSEKACKYCRAQATCPEARESAMQLPVPIPQFMQAEEAALALTDDKLALFLDHAAFAEKVIEACKAEAKRRIEAGKTINGWTLKDGTTRETITDPERVFGRFADLGGKTEDFMSCVTLNKTKLKTALKVATSTKGKELDAQMDALLVGCIESKQNSPSLVRT